MAIADYLNKLIELKNQLVANLKSMGVTADESEKLNTLVPKVLDIETGVDTSDATATAEDIAVGKTAYANGEKLTGTKEPVEQNVEFVEGTDFKGTSSTPGIIKAMTKFNIPDGITQIGTYACYGCTSLASITIPNSVTSIGDYAFYGCTSLASITIPNSVTSIGDFTFRNCTSLIDVKIPGSVIEESYAVFIDCTSLTNVQIEDGFKYLGGTSEDCGFFESCSKLESIIIPSSVIKFGRRLFYNCNNLAHIYYTGTQTQWDAITKGSGWNSYMGSAVSGGTVIHYNYRG